jgi:hypothetical protein
MPLLDHFHEPPGETDPGARPAAVVELVSPAKKDRADRRRAFAVKCAAYLRRGIGLVTVDIVSGRRFNLHAEARRHTRLA